MKKINLNIKNKKRLLIILGSVVVVALILLSIPKNVYQKVFFKDPDIIDVQVNENKPYKVVYVLSEEDKLVGIKVQVEEELEDEISQKWELLTSKVASYPLGFYSPIETSTVLEKYEIYQNQLTLCLSEDFLNSDGKKALASIAWTFCNDDVEEIVIKVNNEKLRNLKNYTFDKIDRSINVNYKFETSYLFEADFITVLHDEDEMSIPVTYFFKDVKSLDYLVSKILPEEIVSNNAYKCSIEDNKFSLDLAVDLVLSTDEIDNLKETLLLNYDVDSISIANNVMTIYEESFEELDQVSGSKDDNTKLEK